MKKESSKQGIDKLWEVLRQTHLVEWGGGIPVHTDDACVFPKLIYRLFKGNECLENYLVDLITSYKGQYAWTVYKHIRDLGGCNYVVYPTIASNLARIHNLQLSEEGMPTRDSFFKLQELEAEFCRDANLDLVKCAEYIRKRLEEEGFSFPDT